MAFCYPKFNIGALIWIWPVPLLCALWTLKSEKRRFIHGFGLGYLSGLTFFLINLSWLHHIHFAACILLSIFLAGYFAIWSGFAATIGIAKHENSPTSTSNSFISLKGAFLNGSAWCGLEWIRGWMLTGFPWNGLGVGLVNDLVMIQIADIIGVTGISFILIFSSTIISSLLLRVPNEIKNSALKAHPDFIIGVTVIMILFFYGSHRLTELPKKEIEIRTLLVQAGVNQDEKWNPESAKKIYDRYWNMTSPYLKLDNANFDLVVWPESSLPYSLHDRETQSYLNRILSLNDYELVLGLNERIPQEGIYNSIIKLRQNTNNYSSYRKTHLVPFGEYVPFRKSIPFVEKIAANALGVDFQPGNQHNTLDMALPEPYQIIPLVCFEDTFGNLARKFITKSPQLIVNVTNDGWFKQSAASEQHLVNAIFRCIELRRPMIRCANTGMSCLIDDCGSLYDRHSGHQGGERLIYGTKRSDTFLTDTLPETIRINKTPKITIYSRFGDAFSISLGLIALLTIFLRILKRR